MEYKTNPFIVDFGVLPAFLHLTFRQQNLVIQMMDGYRWNGQTIQAGKLIDHALGYLDEGKVHEVSNADNVVTYEIEGKHDPHITTYNTHEHSFGCDCSLFKGEGMYEGKAGECSHIQAVRILHVENPPTAPVLE